MPSYITDNSNTKSTAGGVRASSWSFFAASPFRRGHESWWLAIAPLLFVFLAALVFESGDARALAAPSDAVAAAFETPQQRVKRQDEDDDGDAPDEGDGEDKPQPEAPPKEEEGEGAGAGAHRRRRRPHHRGAGGNTNDFRISQVLHGGRGVISINNEN